MNPKTRAGGIGKVSWLAAALWSCTGAAGAVDAPSLKQAANGRFHVGVALNGRQFTEEDAAGVAVITRHFDSITAENAMKWQPIHPAPGTYHFEPADRFVRFGEQRGMFIVGHTLMWHSQTPRWVFEDDAGQPVAREQLLQRLRDHIHTVVGRYKGRVKGWDVVNEAVKDEDGTLRVDRPWYRILGQEGILAAFQAAHEADPAAELYYNDYSLANPVKRAGVLRLVQWLRAQGARVDAVGSQEHCLLDWPKAEEVDAMLRDFAQAGFKVMVTELDVSVLPRPRGQRSAEISATLRGSPEFDPYREGLPPEKQAQLAQRYAELFAVFLKHRGTLTRVTFWGVSDRNSWLNNFPIRGRTDHPLLFDRDYQPKPALEAVIEQLTAAATPRS